MDKLTEEQVFAIQMRWACGVSLKDCAAELGHSMSTISKYYGIAKAAWLGAPTQPPTEDRPHRFSNRREVREQFDVGAQNDARFGGTLDETGE